MGFGAWRGRDLGREGGEGGVNEGVSCLFGGVFLI